MWESEDLPFLGLITPLTVVAVVVAEAAVEAEAEASGAALLSSFPDFLAIPQQGYLASHGRDSGSVVSP